MTIGSDIVLKLPIFRALRGFEGQHLNRGRCPETRYETALRQLVSNLRQSLPTIPRSLSPCLIVVKQNSTIPVQYQPKPVGIPEGLLQNVLPELR